MTANLLTLNSYKTEFLLIGLKNQLAKIQNSSLDTSRSARNLLSLSTRNVNEFYLDVIYIVCIAIAVCCCVCSVSEKKVINDTTRREVRIEAASRQIVVKLWSAKADTDVAIGESIMITNVRTNAFRGIMSLNSTDETSVEVR